MVDVMPFQCVMKSTMMSFFLREMGRSKGGMDCIPRNVFPSGTGKGLRVSLLSLIRLQDLHQLCLSVPWEGNILWDLGVHAQGIHVPVRWTWDIHQELSCSSVMCPYQSNRFPGKGMCLTEKKLSLQISCQLSFQWTSSVHSKFSLVGKYLWSEIFLGEYLIGI